MKRVVDYAKEILEDDELRFYNLQSGSSTAVEDMLRLVRSVSGTRYQMPLPAIEDLALTEGGNFTPENPGDLVALIFETVVRWNRNIDLWSTPGAGGAAGEINTTLHNFSHGPNSVGGSPAEGVHATTYAEALKQLLHIVANRRAFLSGY